MESKIKVYIRFQNGLSFQNDLKSILGVLESEFEFIESSKPDIIIFGPYGIDFPNPGSYIRVGYYCECIKPDLSICDYAFGIPREESVSSNNYCRIQWHGITQQDLHRSLTENEIDCIISSKRKFCNFLYSNKIPYREIFFSQLGKYKKIDAPGNSMSNMPSIDDRYKGNVWERKRQFLNEYKFTIAFENYAFPGYQTEKLYDPMRANSIPIYYGDPYINEIFNTKSFVNVREYLPIKNNTLTSLIEKHCLPAPKCDWSPSVNTKISQRIIRKVNTQGRHLKMRVESNNYNFDSLIEQIIKIDQDDTIYAQYLRQPYLNKPIKKPASHDFWRNIIHKSIQNRNINLNNR